MSTDSIGFFKKFHDSINSAIDDVTRNNFANLESSASKVSYLHGLPAVRDYDLSCDVNSDDFPVKKDLEKALQLKDEGNKAVQKGDWVRSLQLYTHSLMYVPKKDSDELAIVYANRSAALNHLQQFEDALDDINRCLALAYPRHLRYKVLERKARCLLVLKRNQEAVKAFQDTISALDEATNLNKDKRQKMRTDAKLMLEILNKGLVLAGHPKDPEPLKKAPIKPKLACATNKKFPAASDAIQIDQDDVKGRYATAARDIAAGETILIEKPQSAVLLPEYAKTHCQNCFIKCAIPLACPNCPNVIFCSEKCLDTALKTYHAYECHILPILWKSGCSVTCSISLRMLTQNRKDYFKKIQSELDKKPDGPYKSEDYRNVYHLVSHEEKRTKQDFLHRTQMAVFLLKLLELSGFLDGKPRDKPLDVDNLKTMAIPEAYKEDIALFGSLLLKNLQVLQFNAHEVFELQCSRPKPGQNIIKHNGKSVFLAGAVFNTLALFNHSCDPGVVRYFYGPYVIVRAAKNIKKGEEVAENYGPIFTQTPKEQRLADLRSQYWFDCTCTPCQENWPMYEQMTENYMRFKCNSDNPCPNVIPVPYDCNEFMIKCGLCNQYTNILKGLKSLQDTEMMHRLGRAAMESGKYGEAVKKFMEMLKLYDDSLAPPYRSYYDCVQDMRRSMLAMGNYSIV